MFSSIGIRPAQKTELDRERLVLSDSLSDSKSNGAYQQRSRKSLGTYYYPILVLSVTSLFWGAVLFYTVRHTPHFYFMTGKYAENNQIYGLPISGYKFLKCGTSVEEAKLSGCEYDILANHWIPRPCIDPDAIKAYQADGSWYGYAQQNRTELVDMDALGELARYYTSERDHIIHCAMLWRKQYSVFSEGRRVIDSITADPVHTHHCIKYLIDMTDTGQDFREVPLTVNVGFGGCFLGE